MSDEQEKALTELVRLRQEMEQEMEQDEHIKRIMKVLKETAGDVNQYQRAQTIWAEVEKINEEEFLPIADNLDSLEVYIQNIKEALKNGIYKV